MQNATNITIITYYVLTHNVRVRLETTFALHKTIMKAHLWSEKCRTTGYYSV